MIRPSKRYASEGEVRLSKKYTPEEVAEVIARARSWATKPDEYIEDEKIIELADALTAVSAERDAEHKRAESFLYLGESDRIEHAKVEAERDRLHKAITEALAGLELSAEPDWPGWNVLTGTERILRAALDQEGNDDE